MKIYVSAAFVMILMLMIKQSEAGPTDEITRNGIIVEANDEAGAVEAALRQFIELLNGCIKGEVEAETAIKRHFGGWWTKPSNLGSEIDQTNKEKLLFLLSKSGEIKGSIEMASEPPRRIGSPNEILGSYVAVLPLKNAPFNLAALFFRVEAIDKVSIGQFDIALMPGVLFVGEPTTQR
jgi:hypothetical protein